MKRVTSPVSRRRTDRSIAAVLGTYGARAAPDRKGTTERQVTDLTRKASRISLDDLRTIVRVLNYSNESAAIIARLPTWQGGQITRFGQGII